MDGRFVLAQNRPELDVVLRDKGTDRGELVLGQLTRTYVHDQPTPRKNASASQGFLKGRQTASQSLDLRA